MNYEKIALTAKRLINKNGRSIQLYKLDGSSADPTKPWRGAVGAPKKIAPVSVKAVFAIGNTSIPTESRGLAFDWVDHELLKVSRHVCLVAAEGVPILDDYKPMIEVNSTKEWNVIWGQCLQPGDKRLLYCFGFKE